MHYIEELLKYSIKEASITIEITSWKTRDRRTVRLFWISI